MKSPIMRSMPSKPAERPEKGSAEDHIVFAAPQPEQ